MPRKPDQHFIRPLKPDESHWSCGFGLCQDAATMLITNIWFGKKTDRHEEKGACFSCAARWAFGCDGCTRMIDKAMADFKRAETAEERT